MTAIRDVLFVDNFDSFTFNLVDAFSRQGCRVHVYRNDVPLDTLLALVAGFDHPPLVVLSPGPGAPRDAGCCLELVRSLRGRVPVFGVCLGHQVLVESVGGVVEPAAELVHGRASCLEHDGRGLFEGLPNPMTVGRYHSLAATAVPAPFHVHARFDGIVMAMSDDQGLAIGVQFHPESILTAAGDQLLSNVLTQAVAGLTSHA